MYLSEVARIWGFFVPLLNCPYLEHRGNNRTCLTERPLGVSGLTHVDAWSRALHDVSSR
jgi:hypothetical protein